MRLYFEDLYTIGWLRSQLEELRTWQTELRSQIGAKPGEAARIEMHYRWLRAEIENLERLPDPVA